MVKLCWSEPSTAAFMPWATFSVVHVFLFLHYTTLVLSSISFHHKIINTKKGPPCIELSKQMGCCAVCSATSVILCIHANQIKVGQEKAASTWGAKGISTLLKSTAFGQLSVPMGYLHIVLVTFWICNFCLKLQQQKETTATISKCQIHIKTHQGFI